MVNENIIKKKLEEIFEQPIIKVLKYSKEVNGEYLITFVYNDIKYNQITTASLTLSKRIFDK
jgi:hypothetical protein